jgi:hypothetical protein
MQHMYSSATYGRIVRPMHERNWPLHFESDDGNMGAIAYPINYEELYTLKGRLLTIVDATFQDPEQRKAFKDVLWQAMRGWMDDIERNAGPEPSPPPPSAKQDNA